ncbi:hypothetical protein A374_17764 [Fictibacillus macauensis ZFHKF-1]|uniref:Thiol-disulfide oxidoreductase DCC n=1 Tax=Fictibacillus macauensis ZFHKF-1 TaxID=1196324 RepID=I8IWN1_9BACL|nr:thiol-disulfide oxidoreductase DCC family protein [Fictibacillus macauensis]EIT83906.1 hypothetical protein A374_17764 [Fictibacillus macauensis ZFHKF-1]
MAPIVLFDGICTFCNGAVQFLLRHDRKERMQFGALQSEEGQALLQTYGLPQQEFQSLLVIKDHRIYKKSDAALELVQELGVWWQPMRLFRVVPRPVRDAVYDLIARNRYKWFGKNEHCMLPAPNVRHRFLK